MMKTIVIALAIAAVSAVEIAPTAEPIVDSTEFVETTTIVDVKMCYKRCFTEFAAAVWPSMRQTFDATYASDVFMFYPFTNDFRDFETMCNAYDVMKTCRVECGVISDQAEVAFNNMFNFAEYGCVKRRTEIKSFENCYNNVFGNKEFGEMCMNECGGFDFFASRVKNVVAETGIFRADEMFSKIAAFTMSDDFCGCVQKIYNCRRGQFIAKCESVMPFNYYRTITGMAFNSSITMMRQFITPLVDIGIAAYPTVPDSCTNIIDWRRFDNMVTTTTTTTTMVPTTTTTTTTMMTTTTTTMVPTTTTTVKVTTKFVPTKEEVVDFNVDNVAAEIVKEVVVDNMSK